MESGLSEPLVSLVIPAHNEAEHLAACLEAATLLVGRSGLREILVVDDASTDATRAIAERHGARVVAGNGGGAGAARNLGVAAASGDLIWFVDADCVPQPDALEQLLPHLNDPRVAAVGGSYGNMRPDSLLACLIQEEIAARHARMGARVNFLATFNVLYRKSVLQQLGGFDTNLRKGQDAELAFRTLDLGYELAFERRSIVRHFHESSLRRYLAVQWQQGRYRVLLYQSHPGRMGGDSYSTKADHIQPPLALLSVCLLPTLALGPLAILEWSALAGLLGAQLPMTRRLLQRTADPKMLSYLGFGLVRAYARGFGLLEGVFDVVRGTRGAKELRE